MSLKLLPTISLDPNKHPRGVCPFARKAKIKELDLGNSRLEELSAYSSEVIQTIIDYVFHKGGIDSYAIGLPMPAISSPITYTQFADHYRDVTGFFADMCYISEVVCFLAAKTPEISPTPEIITAVITEFKKDPSYQKFQANKHNLQSDCTTPQQSSAVKDIIRSLEMCAISERGRYRGHTIYKGPWYGPHHPRYNPTPVLVMLHGSALGIDQNRTQKLREEMTERVRQDLLDYLELLETDQMGEKAVMFDEIKRAGLIGLYGAEGLMAIPINLDVRILKKVLSEGAEQKNSFSIDARHSLLCEVQNGEINITIQTHDNQTILTKKYSIIDLLENCEMSELGESICSGLYGKLYVQGIYIDALTNNKTLFQELNGYIESETKK